MCVQTGTFHTTHAPDIPTTIIIGNEQATMTHNEQGPTPNKKNDPFSAADEELPPRRILSCRLWLIGV